MSWRRTLSFKYTSTLQYECATPMRALGYNPLEDEVQQLVQEAFPIIDFANNLDVWD